jgi:hypothetical protein
MHGVVREHQLVLLLEVFDKYRLMLVHNPIPIS